MNHPCMTLFQFVASKFVVVVVVYVHSKHLWSCRDGLWHPRWPLSTVTKNRGKNEKLCVNIIFAMSSLCEIGAT